MNKRLSRLQRWILTTAYKSEYKSVTKYEIYRDYYKLNCHTKGGYNVKAFFDDPKESKVKTVCLSRSLKRLFKMGLILDPHRFFEIQLTPDGIMIARELLGEVRPPSFCDLSILYNEDMIKSNSTKGDQNVCLAMVNKQYGSN